MTTAILNNPLRSPLYANYMIPLAESRFLVPAAMKFKRAEVFVPALLSFVRDGDQAQEVSARFDRF